MNVRERAKNYEAFMSKSSSIEKDKGQVGEERIEKSGSSMDGRTKLAERGKTKPVPPPRKKKILDRSDTSPQLQYRSSFTMQVKSLPEAQQKALPSKTPPSSDNEKSKSTKKPPRPAPYFKTPSPSIESKASLPRTANKISPFESSPDTPKSSIKDIPKRPPPPSKTSSLPRKPKPPVPPKPVRPKKILTEEQKEKSATLPITSLKSEKNTFETQNIVETKAERSLTGPLRITLERNEKVEESESESCTFEKNIKDIALGGKENSNLVNDELEDNGKKEVLGKTESESVKETEELKLQNVSESDILSKNGEIFNGVSQQDEQSRTLKNEVLKDDKKLGTIFNEESLNISHEEMEENKSDFFEEMFEKNISGNDKNFTMDDDSERVVEVHNEDEEVKGLVANKEPCSLSSENVDINSGNDHFSELSKESLDLITKVEEKTTDYPEESMNSHCEDNDQEKSQSLSNDETTRLAQQEEPFAGGTSVDMMIEESTEEINRTNKEVDASCAPLVNDRILSEDDIVNSIKYPPNQFSCEGEYGVKQRSKTEVLEDDAALEGEVAAVYEEHSDDQNRPEVVAEVVEEQSDVEDTEVVQPSEELKESAGEEKYDLDHAIPAVENSEGQEREDVMHKENDTAKQSKQDQDVSVKNEEIDKEMLDTQQQDQEVDYLNETNIFEPSGEVERYDLSTQEETNVMSKEEIVSGQIDAIEADMDDRKEKANHFDKLSNEKDIPETSFGENTVKDKDTEFFIEKQTSPEENGDTIDEAELECVSDSRETKSSKPEVDVDLKNDFAPDEQNTPKRPSRVKKVGKNSTEKDTENMENTESLVQPPKEESSEQTEPQTKSIRPYENVVLDVASMEDANSKASLTNLSQHTQQYASNKLNSGYENVILRTEGNKQEECPESESPGVYQVPRRRSFHSHTSEEKVVRKSRSSSIGSFGKSETEYKVPKLRSDTAAEEVYVVPRLNRPPETESTYVLPKANKADSPASKAFSVSESEYHVPRSLIGEDSMEAEYKVPPRTRATNSLEEEGEYSFPRSPIAVPRGSRVVQPTASEEDEGVYSVPTSQTSTLNLGGTETEILPPEDDEVVYSVPNIPLAMETGPCSDGAYVDESLKRFSRSSVLTSRNQLPASFSHAPPKPPRSSIRRKSKNEDQNIKTKKEDEVSKPIPIARNRIVAAKDSPEVEPEAAPRPKQRRFQENVSTEISKDESPTPSPPKDQLQSASPKPKRPAPPRPKAPSVSSLLKENDEKVTVKSEEKRLSAPPRPPPPYVNRTSFAPSEPESLSSTQGFPSGSSESESEEDDKPPESTGLPKKKTYFIAHEILSTEKTFVNALSLCYEDCYSLIRNADVVPEATLNDIFKDLGNIYQLDSKFLQELEERMKTWDENERIGDIVKKYGHFLKMYTTYINNYDKAMNVLQETTKENPQFAELVQQFQASEKCKGLFLVSFMLKPVQRIPSYRLLLKDYLKHLPPDSEEFKDIQVALEIVSEVATHINESMKKADDFERVLRIQESMVGNAEIVKPGRVLIKEGVLNKLCRKDMQERTFFLLTDVLLYTAPVGNTQYKLKEKLPLLGMKVTLPESPDFENEFSIISKMRSFTLSASTPAERDEWIEELNNAINAMTDKKKTFLKSKVGTVVDTEVEEESKLGEKAPVWIPDGRVTMCMLCTDNFTVTNRRHHCRGCGKVVCGSCSDNLAPLAYLDYVQARVCDVCYDFLLKEQNKNDSSVDMCRLPSPLGMTSEDLERIHRKPPKFEILHRFKPSSRVHGKRKSKAFGRPSVCTEVVGHESGSQMSGYLKFKRTNKHGWKRLWFVLKDNVLYSYKASEDVVAIETIPILGYNVQEATRTEDEIQFQLKHAGLPPITFKTESETSISRWIQELKKATTL